MDADRTYYSTKVAGNPGNHNWGVRFDVTGRGYLGITQFDGEEVKDRVLLSPKQTDELFTFISNRKSK